MRIQSSLYTGIWLFLANVGMAGFVPALAQVQTNATPPPANVEVVMLSDLHFDPFHDPAKVPDLVKAPVEEWERILNATDSVTQGAEFAAVQKACKGKELTDAPAGPQEPAQI